jgi:hypothetical protein
MEYKSLGLMLKVENLFVCLDTDETIMYEGIMELDHEQWGMLSIKAYDEQAKELNIEIPKVIIKKIEEIAYDIFDRFDEIKGCEYDPFIGFGLEDNSTKWEDKYRYNRIHIINEEGKEIKREIA